MVNVRVEHLFNSVLDACFKVHSNLDPGVLESTYEVFLAYELQRQGFDVRGQVLLPVFYENIKLDACF